MRGCAAAAYLPQLTRGRRRAASSWSSKSSGLTRCSKTCLTTSASRSCRRCLRRENKRIRRATRRDAHAVPLSLSQKHNIDYIVHGDDPCLLPVRLRCGDASRFAAAQRLWRALTWQPRVSRTAPTHTQRPRRLAGSRRVPRGGGERSHACLGICYAVACSASDAQRVARLLAPTHR